VYMRKVYKAGERMLVDWAGQTMRYWEGNVERAAYVFVAVLPASSLLYAEPFRDMKIESWIAGHVDAFEHAGGVPRLLVPDNTKTAVIKAARHEPKLNKSYHEMAAYYGAAIVPARSRKPQDKAPVETGVQIVERRIIAKLRHTRFESFEELKEAVEEELEALNKAPFQKLPGSRMSVFLETEKDMLMKLPPQRYEYATWKLAKVPFDYHVSVDKEHLYSVPHQFAGEMVQIRATSGTIEVFLNGERIACHARSFKPYPRFITDPAHMPDNHKAVSDWNPERFISWALKTGEKTKEYIASLMAKQEHPEQAFRTCAGILRLAESVPPEVMEQAAAEAMATNVYSYRYFAKLLESKKADSSKPISHGNLRGPGYYEGGNHGK